MLNDENNENWKIRKIHSLHQNLATDLTSSAGGGVDIDIEHTSHEVTLLFHGESEAVKLNGVGTESKDDATVFCNHGRPMDVREEFECAKSIVGKAHAQILVLVSKDGMPESGRREAIWQHWWSLGSIQEGV